MAEEDGSAPGPFGVFSRFGEDVVEAAPEVDAPTVDLEELDEDITETAESTLDNEDASVQDAVRTGLARVQESQQFLARTQTGAATGEIPKVPEQRSDEEFAEDVQRGTIEFRENLAKGAQEAGEGTPADSPQGRFLGTLVGSTFDAIVTDPAASAFKGLTGIDPLGERETFASGDDQVGRDEAVTGSTEEPFTGTDAFNVATTATGLAAAKYGGRAALKGAKKGGTKAMGITSLIDEAGTVTRSADEGVAVTDDILDAPSQREAGELADMSFDEFASVDSSVRADDVATQSTSTADEIQFEEDLQSGIDDAIDRLESPRPANTDFGPRAAVEADESASVADESFDFADDAGDTDESFIRNLLNVGEDASTGSDEFADVARSADEQANAARVADGGEDAAQAARSGDNSGGLFSSLLPSRSTTALGAGVGGAGVGGVAALTAFGSGGSVDVPRKSGPYERANTFQVNGQSGVLVEITPDVGSRGYAVVITSLGSPMSVLSRSGQAVTANISAAGLQDGNPGLEARFSTVQTARRTFTEWANAQGGVGDGRSTEWDGSLTSPNELRRGKRLTAEAVIRNSDRSATREATFVLALETQGSDPAALDRQRASVNANENVTVSFSAASRRIEPGSYTLALYATEGDSPGKIDTSSITITGSEGGDSPAERSKWGDATRVRQLPEGWTLYRLRSKDGSETAFVVAGTRSDGSKLYLAAGGQVREEAYIFEEEQNALDAVRAWLERNANGDTDPENSPSEATQSPSPEQVRQDAAESSTGPLGGILSAMSSNPLYAVGGVAIAGGAVLYLSGGDPIAWLEDATDGLLGTGGA